jgi:hypothetical protein
MTPAGVTLRIEVLKWPDDRSRAAAISALMTEAPGKALVELPTLGYLWASGSGVGYALKYAHQAPASDGGERMTVVTDKPVGAYSFQPWAADNRPPPNAADYSVIELYLDADGHGVGTMSLAAEIALDEASSTVSLATADPPVNVLTDAACQPKPYWADDGQ